MYTNFYGGKPSVNNTDSSKKLLPGKVSLAVSALLACIFTVITTLLYSGGAVGAAVPCFIIASAVLSYLLIFVRKPAILALPAAALAISLVLCRDAAASCAVACGVLAFAALYAACHIRLLPSFRQFFITAGAFALVGAVLFCIIIYSVYGALGEGIVAFGARLAREAESVASVMASEGTDYATALYVLESVFSSATVYLPAVIASLGIVCAWLMRGVFSLHTRLCGMPSLFVGRESTAPRALAAIYLLCSFGGVAAAFSAGSLAFVLSNITMVLSFVFLGEGARILAAFVSRCVKAQRHALFVVTVILALVFFTAAFAAMLPYCGAIAVLLSKGRRSAR